MNATFIESKQELFRALSQRTIEFTDGFEVVNEMDLKTLVERTKALLRLKKKLHVVVLERP